jgi:ribosome-binding factor A
MANRGARPPSQRQLRIGEQLRHAIAAVIERGELRDPDLDGVPVTVTEVRISPDLRNASIFVVPLGGAGEILPPLRRAIPFFQRRVSEMVQLKYVPQLNFEADLSFDHADRIRAVLDSVGLGGDVGETAGPASEKDEGHGP